MGLLPVFTDELPSSATMKRSIPVKATAAAFGKIYAPLI
jgi:hypothetical protein